MLSDLSHLSKSPGIGGSLKNAPQDFIVEEIGPDGTVFELDRQVAKPGEGGKFVHFVLQKRNWSTSSALSEIGKRLRTGSKQFNAAGMKDKVSVSTQLVSAHGLKKEDLLSITVRDMKVNGAWPAKERVHLGQLLGNRFTIRVRDAAEDAEAKVKAIAAELGNRFPNYFGEQRFGSTRQNTHLIGEKMLAGKTEEAVRSFLCDEGGEENVEAVAARKELAASGDYAAALKNYPKHLRLERTMLAYLANNPVDHLGALRKLPRNIPLLFVHAFQSYLFNRLLSDRIAEGGPELEQGEYFCGETLGFPDMAKTEAEGWIVGRVVGYQTMPNERERRLLEELGISREAFRMKSMPEIASKGAKRTVLAPLKDFNFSADTFRFALPSGSYATVALREFIDVEKGK